MYTGRWSSELVLRAFTHRFVSLKAKFVMWTGFVRCPRSCRYDLAHQQSFDWHHATLHLWLWTATRFVQFDGPIKACLGSALLCM